MGKIVKSVVSFALPFVLGALGTLIGGPLGGLIGASLGSIGASALAPKAKAPRNSPENQNRLRANIDPLTPRKTVVGITALATDIRDEEFTDSQTYFHRFIVCASHKVQSIDEIWFDDKRVWTSAGGVQGDAVGYLTVATRTEGSAANAINISSRMGTTRRYTGLAYVHLRYKLTGNSKKAESPYAQSITTRITIRGKAAFLPDPRDPAQDMEDQSTWAWDADACRNPALALLFYLLGWRINGELAVGKGIPPDRIDLDSFITAANLCDEPVDKVGGGTEPRYRCDGAWSEADDPTTVIDMLKATMNADLDDVGGKLRLTVFHNDLATPVVDFNDNDIIDGFTWQPQQPLDATFNVVRGLYTDASDASLYQQADYPEQREDSPDGIDRLDTFNLPMVQSAGQAQRLAALRLARQQYGGVFEADFQATAWKVSKNSVVRLSFSQTGFTTKFFRVAEMTVQQDGVVPLVLREEDPAIYGDPPITGAISPIFSTPYDPALNPLVQAINLNEQTLIAISSQVGITITATDDTITVSAHDREYRDKLVAIAGVVITTDAAGGALVPDTTYYLYYDDGDRDGLDGVDPLEWKATTDFIAAQNSAANPLRHFAGIITTDIIGGTGTVGSGVGGVDSIAAPGPPGPAGLNSAAVFIYQRAASAPAAPSVDATYTFATGGLTGLNNGWTATIPAATGQPLWVRQASASSIAATDVIASAEWSTAQQLAADGTVGGNSAVVFIYQRAATAPASPPSNTLTYTFATGVLSGTINNGWSATIPAANGQPLWVRTAVAFGAGATDTIATGEWSSSVQLVQDGNNGTPGANAATVFLYRRSATAPAVPSVTSTYTFATGVLTGQNNSWTQTIPAGSDPLYVITAAAISTGTTDTILTGEWSSPTVLAQDGVAGLNTARVLIYRRAATTPTLPSAVTTFTFATGALTGLNNSWTTTIPAADGNPLWVSAATASATTATDTIAAVEWAAPVIIVQDGPTGGNGLNSAAVFIYQRAAAAPASPSVDATYTFATGAISGLNNGWTATVPAANGQPLWVRQASASSTTATDTITSGEWAAAQQLAADGVAGGNTAVVYVYQRAAASPASPPSNTLTYTFATGVLSGTLNNGWSATIPAADGNPLWIRTAVAFSSGTTDTIATGEWSGSVRLAQDGATGPAGLNNAAVFIYKRAASAPSDTPATGAVYTFATGALTGTLNGWTTAVPAANGNPLWVRQASASATTATDTIANTEWSAVQQLTADGAAGGNTAVVYVYQRAATAPANPPTNTLTYTFGTGVLSGTFNNGWSATIPAANGNPLWVRTAVAFSAGATDTIATGEWSSSVQLSADGNPGPTITLVASSGAFTFTDNVADPSSQTITIDALLSNITGTVTWTTTPTVTLGGSGNSRTLSLANFGTNRQVIVQAALGGVTQVLAIIRLERNIVAPGNANRVPFSRMEGNQGWKLAFNAASLVNTPAYGTLTGRRFYSIDFTTTGSGQECVISQAANPAAAFPVTAGERLSVQARITASGPVSTWSMGIYWVRSNGTLTRAVVASGSGTVDGASINQAAFLTAPTDGSPVVGGFLDLAGFSSGAGTMKLLISEPMVTSAAVGQTVHPPFSPGPNSEDGSDTTRAVSGPADVLVQFRSDLTLTSPLPVTADYQLTAAGLGALTSGVTWAVSVLSGTFASTAPSIVGSGGGQLRINSALTSPEAQLRLTATVGGKAFPPFVVTVRRQVAPPTTAALTSISTSSFAIAHEQPIQVTLPSGVTSVTLTAVADLFLAPVSPVGASTVEGKWQRESSPGTWADVGSVATSSPPPEVFETEIAPGETVFSADAGSITCNRTATGLTAGSIQRFRFVARVSLGNIRDVTFLGNASAVA